MVEEQGASVVSPWRIPEPPHYNADTIASLPGVCGAGRSLAKLGRPAGFRPVELQKPADSGGSRGTWIALVQSVDAILQDVRYALRMIARSPGVTVVALVTIGIATGANATVFAFVSALLLRPAPGVADPRSLVSLYTSDFSSGPYGTSSYPDFESLKAGASAFADLAAEENGSGVVTWQNAVERVPVSRVTGNYFRLLGVGVSAGRLVTAGDTQWNAPPVAVVSDRLWRRALGARTDVVGSPLNINGESHTVVGIAKEGWYITSRRNVRRWGEPGRHAPGGEHGYDGTGHLR